MLGGVPRLIKSTVFRLSLIAAGLFIASSVIVLGYIYYASVTAPLNEIKKEIEAELDVLVAEHEKNGLNGINREVIIRMRLLGPNIYFLKLPAGQTANLNQPAIFEEFKNPNKVVRFLRRQPDAQNQIDKDSGVRRGIGLFRPLYNGLFIFVGRDVEDQLKTAERLQRALFIAAMMSLILGLASGIYVSGRFARRIDSLNRLATDIRGGDWSRRAPLTQSGDELDDLAEHLNGMLDHINTLMSAMRYAGDSIAHDLRSPLTRLRTRLETSANEINDPIARETLIDAAENADELLQTFDSVLRIARLEAGDRRELLVPVDPKPLLDDLAELYELSFEDAGLKFETQINAVDDILADRGLLSQAVSNLLENAIKYNEPGGKIVLELNKTRNGRVTIAVVDDGPGIPEAQRQRVKERFVRLEDSRSKPGSGLGLSLVTAVADLHRATFELGNGHGSDESRPGLRSELIFPRYKA
ncbi:sensor histidine kinase [Robiginitomaculum antarcticum]|uniref:sensor histidine kinase n=1 Tax=Robiginitomaculum antarcticum TaxID=437507 RepID=UPI000379B770|nr:HAMP domain-containing sensor histidine kinase [Robiginitomaculum antarcticum]